jgi:hypothetical protein
MIWNSSYRRYVRTAGCDLPLLCSGAHCREHPVIGIEIRDYRRRLRFGFRQRQAP